MSYNPEYGKRYRAKNKERLKLINQKWYKLNKTKVIERVTNIHKMKMQTDPSYVDKIHEQRAKSERKSCRKPNRKKKIQERKTKISQLKNDIKLYYKCLNPCCKWQGEIYPYCLDFHHVDKTSKKFNIGTSPPGRSIKSLLEEISKCTILCAVCHRQEIYGNLDASLLPKCDISKFQQKN